MTPLRTLAQICREAASALGRELTAWKTSPARATFGTEAMLSVALSVVLANALHLTNTWWAAISGFAVMQTSFPDSVKRALHRILGTVLGACLGTMAGPWIGDRPWLFVPVLGLIGGIAIYRANGSRFSYTWILGAATALMVTYEAHELASLKSTAAFAILRVAEVVVGTLACVMVSGAFHVGQLWYRRRSPAAAPASADAPGETFSPAAVALAPAPPAPQSSRPARMLLGMQGGLAIAVLAALTYVLHLPGFAQAMVTTVAVLILPAAMLVSRARRPIFERMVHRFAGCLLAGVIGVALLPLMQGQAVLCVPALALGVWAGCHVQTGQQGATYIGRQFTIAFIMVFVQDHHWSANPVPALMRLSGILTGILVLAAVMVATSKPLPVLSQGGTGH